MTSSDRFARMPEALRTVFLKYHARKRKLFARIAAVRLAVLYAGLVLLAAHLDRFLRFGIPERTVSFLVVHALVVLVVAGIVVLYRRLRVPPEELGYEIEAQVEGSAEHIVSAYRFLHPAYEAPEQHRNMLAILTRHAEEAARGLALHPTPSDRHKRLHMGGAAFFALFYIVLLAIPSYEFPLMLQRFYQPWSDLPRPSFTKILFEAYPNPAGKGTDVTIPVKLEGRLASEAWIAYGRKGASEGWPREKMVRVGKDRFLHTFYDVQEDFAFRVLAGDGETEARPLRVVAQPAVEDLRVTVTYPEYTGLAAATFEDPGDLEILENAAVEVAFRCDQALADARIVSAASDGEETTHALDLSEGAAAWTIGALEADTTYRILLRNEDGFANLDQQERRFILLKDRPPNLQIEDTEEVLTMFPTEERTFRVDVQDDLGVRDLTLVYLKNPDPDVIADPDRTPLETFDPAKKAFKHEFVLNLEELSVEPGDVVELKVEGMDTNQSFGQSNQILIRVVSFEPGLEEQERIQTLRFYAELFRALGALPPERCGGGRFEFGEEEAQRLKARFDTLKIESFPFAQGPEPVLRRLLVEQDLTPFYAYKSDLRALLREAGAALLAEPLRPKAPAALAALAETALPAMIEFRFHRNLLRTLGAFREEVERMKAAEGMSEANRRKRAEQLRSSLERWMGYLAQISRESRSKQRGFETFAGHVESINTLAFDLQSGGAEAGNKLQAALDALRDRCLGLLPSLAAELEKERAASAKRIAAQEAVLLSEQGLDAPGEADRRRDLYRWIHLGFDRDPAVAPEETIRLFLARAALHGAEGRKAAFEACRAFDPSTFEAVKAAAALYRETALEVVLERLRNDRAMGAWNKRYDTEYFREEHERCLKALGAAADDPAAAMKRYRAGLEAFDAAVAKHAGDPATRLPAMAAELVKKQTAFRKELDALAEMLANVVPDSTLEERTRLLAGYRELMKTSRQALALLRIVLAVDVLAEDLPSDAARIGWTRVLVRFFERLEHFRRGAANPVAILVAFDGQAFDVKQRDLFPTNVNTIRGANNAIQRPVEALAPATESAAVDEDFFAEEAARLKLTERVETIVREALLLDGAVRAEDGAVKTTAAREVLSANEAILVTVLVRRLHPRLVKLRETVEAMSALAGGMVGKKTVDPAERKRLATGLDAAGRLLGETTTFLRALPGDGPEQLGREIAPLAEKMAALAPRNGEPPAPNRASLLLSEAKVLVERLVRSFARMAETGIRVTPTKNLTLEERATLAAKRLYTSVMNRWQTEAVGDLLAVLDGEARLAAGAYRWRAAAGLYLSPVMLQDPQANLMRRRYTRAEERRHWIVKEFEESLRSPLPRRHKTSVKAYYDRLKRGFREHEHTR